MQDSHGLSSARIDRHSAANKIVANFKKLDAELRSYRVDMHPSESFNGRALRLFPDRSHDADRD
jgi:hypothetical protein